MRRAATQFLKRIMPKVKNSRFVAKNTKREFKKMKMVTTDEDDIRDQAS